MVASGGSQFHEMLVTDVFQVSGFPMVTIIGLFFAIVSVGQAGSTAPRDRVASDFLSGPKFHAELDKAAAGSWENVDIRELLDKLAAESRIAILLDRRVDPNARIPLEIVNRSLKEGLNEIARQLGAGLSVPENVVFIGAPTATRRLRTVIELRSAELAAKSTAVPESRRIALARRQSYSWGDLQTPGEILQRIAGGNQLEIRNSELVPHDLWAGNTLPNVTAAAALSLVLIQFDLTFAWIEGGRGIELAPIPEIVVVERRSRSKGRSAADTLKMIAEQLPDLDVQLDGSELLVRGTVEEHEAVMALLNPSTAKKPTAPGLGPLRQRIFTLTYERAPVRAVMKELEKTSIVFVYDAAALDAAGVNFDQTVDLKLNKASADEFLKALFSPLKLSFEIDNLTVKLTPKR